MKEINLKVTVDDVNLILEGLGNLPFVKVYTLIGKIQEQSSQQIKEENQPNQDADQTESAES